MKDPTLLARAHALFDRVLDLEPADRAEILDRECADEPELRSVVEALIDADRTDHPLLDSGTAAIDMVVDASSPKTTPGADDRIGPYRIIREAGRGGMATVYLAERQAGGARQRVALKLVRRGVDTDEVIRRFAQETRVLASLEHPNIARFFDAGASDDGRPYLAMEFIEGEPVTAYADRRKLGIADRLALFRTVCGAVQFAHQRLVVHRDIKPSNVLVTARGTVKLLDFGIAKLVSDEPDDSAPLTRTGIRVLTPEYAAPEQIRGEPISTATDVYALGVVLYELLTGGRPKREPRTATTSRSGPHDTGEVRDAASPSTAVRDATREGGAASIADARGTTPDRLRRRLQGDLDRIALKALEADPTMRYQSALELRDDLQRHADGLPLLARPGTVGYRLRKFARRHRAGLTAAVVAVVSLAGFSAFHTVRITRERDVAKAETARAQATTQFMQRLLGDAYPSVALGDTFSMGDLLRRAVARVDSLDAQPELQAELLRTLGDVYREQGRFDDALPLLERAVAIHRATDGMHDRTAGLALDALGHLQYERRDYTAALAAHQESLDVYEPLFAPDDSLVLFALNNIATAASALGDYDEAMRLHQAVLSRHGRLFADTSQLVHVTRNNLGQLYHERGEYENAERELREAIRLRRIALPPDHPSLALTINNLGTTLERLGRLDEAEAMHREALEMFRQVYGPDHHRVGLSAYNLARVLRLKGHYDEAETLNRLTLSIDRSTYGERHMEVGVDLRGLGFLLREKGDCEGAVTVLGEADEIFAENGLPVVHRRRLTARSQLGACLADLHRYTEAEQWLTGNLDAARAAPEDADSAAVRETVDFLAALYESSGRPSAADSVRESLGGLVAGSTFPG